MRTRSGGHFWGQEPSTVANLIAAIPAVISAIREIEPPT